MPQESEIRVVILCGGQGTRLREETEFRPKPLVEIGQRPILWHIMKMYAHFGFHHFVLCLGYRGNMIKEYFLNYEAINNDFTISLGSKRHLTYHGNHREQDFQVTLVDTGLRSMTGGRVKRVQPFVDHDTFLVAYGDCVADVNLRSLVNYHREHGKLATVTVVRPISRFGILDMDDNQRVARFAEKPLMDSWASAGFFVFNRRVFDYLDGDGCILEREPLERLTEEGQLVAFRHDGFFFAMDTYREYQALNELWEQGDAPWAVWNR
jgi:glucose-1-phosphate cytidylyltransferase